MNETPSGLLIRPMTVSDLERVLQVERASYRSPWHREDFFREITYNQMAYYYVAELEGTIAGFIGLWLIVDEAHITNVAVDPDSRRHGTGERLLLHAIAIARSHQARCCILEVRVTNQRAQNLYFKHRFRIIGLRKAYYRDNNEDAFLMQKDFSE